MVTYNELLKELEGLSERKFADFQRRIICDDVLEIMGVRTPTLRKLAKKYKNCYGDFEKFPDKFYEVVFLKLAIAATLDFNSFCKKCEKSVRLITDWALCDSFAPACIKKHRDEFVPYIKKFLSAGKDFYSQGEYTRRFALTTLLHFYVEDKYFNFIFECISECRPDKYYVMMAAAWLLAEVLIKDYNKGFEFLNSTMCDINIKLKAISKACDSFRVTDEQKTQLKALRAELKKLL